MERAILHVDLDAFFASVEVLKNPALKGKAVIVGGDPEKRGVVSTCSYEARKFGVRSAMPLFEAKKKCPHAIFVSGSYAEYRDYSEAVMEILRSFSTLLEIVGIDEAYLEVTGEKLSPFKIGQEIRQKVYQNTGLTCSVGIGSNKLIAKIASSMAKPNGLYEVPQGCEIPFLAPLPIQSIPGIGMKTQTVLNIDGIHFVKDLQAIGMQNLIQRYGTCGYSFYLASLGRDSRPVSIEDSPPKSIGAESTFEKNVSDQEVLLAELDALFEKGYRRLRRHRMRSRGISIKLRFADFKTITRSHTFFNHTNDEFFLLQEVRGLFLKVWEPETPLRLIGFTFEKLSDTYWQPTFWD